MLPAMGDVVNWLRETETLGRRGHTGQRDIKGDISISILLYIDENTRRRDMAVS